MSYTMTLDAPRRVLTHATRNGRCSQKEMSRLFVAFLTSQYLESRREEEAEDPVSRVVGCIKTEKSSDALVKELRGFYRSYFSGLRVVAPQTI